MNEEFGRTTRNDVEQRFVDGAYNFYTQSTFLVKGGVFAVAAGVFLEVFSGSASVEIGERGIFFIASCCVALIPVATFLRGAVLTSGSVSYIDYFAPFGMGFAEILMFWSLSPDRAGALDYRSVWLFGTGLQATFAVLVLHSRLAASPVSHFGESLAPLVVKYRLWMWGDLFGAAVFAISAFALAWLGLKFEFGNKTISLEFVPLISGAAIESYSAIASVFGALAVFISFKALREQEEIGQFLRDSS